MPTDSFYAVMDSAFKQFANLLPQIVWIADEEGNLEHLNGQWEHQTGRSTKAALGTAWIDLVHPGDRQRVRNGWSDAFRRRRPVDLHARLQDAQGSYRRFRIQGRLSDDAEAAWYGTMADLDPIIGPDAENDAAEAAGTTVLLVEDNADSQVVIRRMLRHICRVRCAGSSEEALDLVSRERFSTILVDINLGDGADGVALLEAIREMKDYENVPIAAVTAYALPGDRERFLRAGFTRYLAKPFTASDLASMTQDLLEQSSLSE